MSELIVSYRERTELMEVGEVNAYHFNTPKAMNGWLRWLRKYEGETGKEFRTAHTYTKRPKRWWEYVFNIQRPVKMFIQRVA